MYIFGYGSIINIDTRENKSLEDIPVRLHGYERDWNARIDEDKATAFGITKKASAVCNGVLVSITPDLLVELDAREKKDGYQREIVNVENVEVLSDHTLKADDLVHLYSPLNPQLANSEYPMEQTYIDVALYGCWQHGEEFLREFIATTKWDYPLMHDRANPNYSRWKPSYVNEDIERIFFEEIEKKPQQ